MAQLVNPPRLRGVSRSPGVEYTAEGSLSRRARIRVGVSLWGVFVSNITLTILTIALPRIAEDLDADPGLTNWVTLAPMLVVALLTPAAGRAADLYGRKRMWLTGLTLSLAGMAISGLAPSLPPLLGGRLLTGMGGSMLMPAALAIATQPFPPSERARPIGYWTSTMALSPMLGILLGGWVIEHVTWRWLFAGQIALGLPALLCAALFFDNRRYPVEGRFDVQGAVLIGGAALSAMLGATWLPDYAFFSWRVSGMLLVAGALGAWAVRVEQRVDNPVAPPAVLRDVPIRLALITRSLLSSVYMGVFITLPYFLTEMWHFSPWWISTALLPRPLAMGVTGTFVGKLAARFGASRLVVAGSGLLTLATGMFAMLDTEPALAWLIPALVIAGHGLGLSASGTASIVTSRVSPQLLGTASGLLTLSATLANVLGMAVMFAGVELFGGVQEAIAYRSSFLLGTLLVAVGLALAVRVRALVQREEAGYASRPSHAPADVPQTFGS